MAEARTPLRPISDNTAVPGSSGSETSPTPKLFPIFLGQRDPGSSRQQRPVKLRKAKSTAKNHGKVPTRLSDEDDDTDEAGRNPIRLSTFFAPSTPLRVGSGNCGKPADLEVAANLSSAQQPWRRSRKRLGLGIAAPKPQTPLFQHFVTRLSADPHQPPSTVFLPSLNSPTGQDREHDPALVVAFNWRAKVLTREDAALRGEKRLLAIGGEEGAIRIIDVDAPQSDDGRWWSAHQNGVFDLSWCDDDRHILSASADQTLRLHDLSDGEPRSLVTLRGHTSTIKSTAFLEEHSSNLIASGGRDGNINIYDLRCRGYSASRVDDDEGPRRPYRTRSATEADLAVDSSINPVLTLRQPHNVTLGRRSSIDSRSVTRTITSLVALRAQAGTVLASGGSYDGVVKLWDVRCPEATSSLRTRCTPVGVLPDPTVRGDNPSRRPRSVNALCEQPSTGDLFALCGDSKVHVLRPSAATVADTYSHEAVLPRRFVHPDLNARSFYIRMALSPDGQYLSCGSSSGGVMLWDVNQRKSGDIEARRLHVPRTASETPEVIALDWGKDMIAASADDCSTRVWHTNVAIARELQGQDSEEWSGIA